MHRREGGKVRNGMTIVEALKSVMQLNGNPMSPKECYEAIVEAKLYQFHTDKPINVVVSQIRRHCRGLDFPSAATIKHFQLSGDNRYTVLEKPCRPGMKRQSGTRRSRVLTDATAGLAVSLRKLLDLRKEYVLLLKRRILADLKCLSTAQFEIFAKALLDVYGFEGTQVTRISSDGGIDGYGKLKVGLAHLNVAFQCKRWISGNIQRPEIDRFRGAAQGDFEQGIFFTTTSFSSGAIEASIKKGAVPIVLIDGPAIVDLMIEKRFGVQAETVSIPTYALDVALSPDQIPGDRDGNS
jgi:restriction system protein